LDVDNQRLGLARQASFEPYLAGGSWAFVPLDPDHQPSFLMDLAKNLFYGYRCGRMAPRSMLPCGIAHSVHFVRHILELKSF
jgi:hypothetical protein